MRESRDKRGGFHFKKAKKPDSRDKKREIKRIAKRKVFLRYLEDGVRILAIIVVFYFFLKKKKETL